MFLIYSILLRFNFYFVSFIFILFFLCFFFIVSFDVFSSSFLLILNYFLYLIYLNILIGFYNQFLVFFFFIIIKVILLLIVIAYSTLAERKIMSSIQRRKGPNVVGLFGLLQPLADGLKLFLKEIIFLNYSNSFLFFISPVLTFFCSLILWSLIPYDSYAILNDFFLLFVLSISSFGIYGLLFSGWSSNSKYSFLGGVRSAAQMISYEINLGVILLHVFLFSHSFSIFDIVDMQRYCWFVFPLFPIWILFIISALAETNRAPFDLPEAEAELVAGYNVEYSSMCFALFFLGEYGNILFMCFLSTLLFWGGGYFFGFFSFFILGLKVCLHFFLFVWIRAAFPRFRYDHLMRLGWKVFLPIVLGSFFFYSSLLFLLF